MSAPISNQIDGLRVLARRLNFKSLAKVSAMRDTEAQHLINMVKDAADTLERIERGEEID